MPPGGRRRERPARRPLPEDRGHFDIGALDAGTASCDLNRHGMIRAAEHEACEVLPRVKPMNAGAEVNRIKLPAPRAICDDLRREEVRARASCQWGVRPTRSSHNLSGSARSLVQRRPATPHRFRDCLSPRTGTPPPPVAPRDQSPTRLATTSRSAPCRRGSEIRSSHQSTCDATRRVTCPSPRFERAPPSSSSRRPPPCGGRARQAHR